MIAQDHLAQEPPMVAEGRRVLQNQKSTIGVHQSSIGWFLFSGAAAAAFAFGDEAERAVERTILAIDRSAAHGAGEADEFVCDGPLVSVTPHSQTVQTGLQAQDLFPRGFGIFDVIFEFFGGDVPEFVLRGELKPGNEKISGPLENVLVAEFFHGGWEVACRSGKMNSNKAGGFEWTVN